MAAGTKAAAAAALCFLLAALASGNDEDDNGVGVGVDCGEGRIAMYRLSVRGLWSPESFPKNYPDWGPAASFSKLIGEPKNKPF